MQKKKHRLSLPKDPNAALQVLAARKERLEALDPEQREKREERDRWDKVTLKAEGEKVRDDERRLKKMAKRQEQIKSKSAKAWAERSKNVQAGIKQRLDKREANLKARNDARKEKKMSKGGAKAGSTGGKKTKSSSHAHRPKAGGRPGFEGRGKKAKK